MITVLPIDKNEINKVITKLYLYENTKKDDIDILVAKKDNEYLGLIAVCCDDIYLKVLDINIEKDLNFKIAELLLKSAASYAMNRNLFTLKCENSKLYPLLLQHKGEIIENCIYIDIIKLISCNGCK